MARNPIPYFHETVQLNAEATSVPVYRQKKDGKVELTGYQPLDVTLYFDPYINKLRDDNRAFANQIGSFKIATGADEITWGYGLNTRRIPTYGGEVVQILSMYADKMRIKGTCRNYKELRAIYDYFKKYMSYVSGASGAGTDRRQNFLQFRYPARDWSFVIMVTEAPNMRMATAQAAPEWELTAEIVSENDRMELGANRMDEWANTLKVAIPSVSQLTPSTSARTRSLSGAGTTPVRPAETGAAITGAYRSFKVGQGADPFGDLMGFANGGRGAVADNFEAMMASYVTGTISTLRTNPLTQPDKSAQDIYTEKYGTEIAFTSGGGGATGSGDTTGSSPLSGTLEPVMVAALAANGFKKIGKANVATRDVLIEAVKVAAGESGWDTRSINYNGSGGQEDYSTYINGDASVAPTSSNGGNRASYDLGLWQINNYWHPNEIRVACGEDVSPTSPQAGSAQWQESVNHNASSGNQKKLLDDALVNAKAMAVIYTNNRSWESWVAYSERTSGYTDAENKAKEAVDKYLANPAQYDQRAITGNYGNGAAPNPPNLNSSVRHNAVAWAQWMLDNPNIRYDTPPNSHLPLRRLSRSEGPSGELSLDCSSAVSYIIMWAGGKTFSDVLWSGAMMDQLTKINYNDVAPGDVWATLEHAEMAMRKEGGQWTCFSHGGDGTKHNATRPHTDTKGDDGNWYRWPGMD